MVLVILIIVVIVVVIYLNKGKTSSNKIQGKAASPYAVSLAEQYLDTFKNAHSIQEMNNLSEDMIQMAGDLWARGDYEGYNVLLNAAKETSFMYQGSKYRHDLVEDLIRESH